MDIRQLDLTNILLAVLAAVAVLQALALAVLLIWAKRALSTMTQTVARLDSEHIRPLLSEMRTVRDQATAVIADARGVVGRVAGLARAMEARTERLLARYDAANDRVDSAIDASLDVVTTGLHGLRAVEVGVRRGLRTLLSNGR